MGRIAFVGRREYINTSKWEKLSEKMSYLLHLSFVCVKYFCSKIVCRPRPVPSITDAERRQLLGGICGSKTALPGNLSHGIIAVLWGSPSKCNVACKREKTQEIGNPVGGGAKKEGGEKEGGKKKSESGNHEAVNLYCLLPSRLGPLWPWLLLTAAAPFTAESSTYAAVWVAWRACDGGVLRIKACVKWQHGKLRAEDGTLAGQIKVLVHLFTFPQVAATANRFRLVCRPNVGRLWAGKGIGGGRNAIFHSSDLFFFHF